MIFRYRRFVVQFVHTVEGPRAGQISLLLGIIFIMHMAISEIDVRHGTSVIFSRCIRELSINFPVH